MDYATLKSCLEKDGWPIEPVSENTIRTMFRAAGRVFSLYLHLEPEPDAPPGPGAQFVTFAIFPFVRMPEEYEGVDVVARKLLKLNRDMNLAKFSVDEDGDVVLSVEYRRDDLDASEVRDALDVLSFYAEKHYPEIERVAASES